MSKMKGAMIKAGLTVMSAKQREGVIISTMQKALNKINERVDVKKVKEEKAFGEERSVNLIIHGFSPQGLMFVLTDSGVILDTERSREPTCTIYVTEDTFIEVARGHASFYDVLCAYGFDVEGDHIMRDLLVLSEIFTEFSHILTEEAVGL